MKTSDLIKLVNLWDKHKYEEIFSAGNAKNPEEHQQRKLHENIHKEIYEDIMFLSEMFFSEYDLNRPRDFERIFLDWLEQFQGNLRSESKYKFEEEKRIAFLLVDKILFFNRLQIIELIKTVWQKILKTLINQIQKEKGLRIFDIIFDDNLIREKLNECIFVPLSDSSHFNEFRHECFSEGESAYLTYSSIDNIIDPTFVKYPEIIDEIKEKLVSKKNIFILEDFTGSGTTFMKYVINLIKYYDFKNIYFCPYLANRASIQKILNLKKKSGDKIIEIIPGIILEDDYSFGSDKSSSFIDHEFKIKIRELSKKYFKSHFKTNKYLYHDFTKKKPNRPAVLGFKDNGLTMVLYRNCPSNSLPIIWAQDNSWRPLFKRNERISKKIQ